LSVDIARGAGVVLALLALLAMPARPILACTMSDAVRASAHSSALDDNHDAGHHDSPHVPAEHQDDTCADIAACAVMALPSVGVSHALHHIDGPVPMIGTAVGVEDPARSLEPPPPKV